MPDVDRIATIIEWAHQDRPCVLAPDMRMADLWLHSIDPLWLKGLKRKPYLISAHNGDRSLRGLNGGTLVVVKAGYRNDEMPHRLNDKVDDLLIDVVPLTRMSVWVEWLP
jgi:hypothetical protein